MEDLVTIQITKEELAKKWAYDNGCYFITNEAINVLLADDRCSRQLIFNSTKLAYSLNLQKYQGDM